MRWGLLALGLAIGLVFGYFLVNWAQTIQAEKEIETIHRISCEQSFAHYQLQAIDDFQALRDRIQSLEGKCTTQYLLSTNDVILTKTNYNTITFQGNNSYPINVTRVGDTGSMRPTISDWSYLLTSPNLNNLTIGDIIIFKWKGQRIAHRLIRIDNISGINSTFYYTKGDNNNASDWETKTKEDIEARVIGVIY